MFLFSIWGITGATLGVLGAVQELWRNRSKKLHPTKLGKKLHMHLDFVTRGCCAISDENLAKAYDSFNLEADRRLRGENSKRRSDVGGALRIKRLCLAVPEHLTEEDRDALDDLLVSTASCVEVGWVLMES